MAIYKSDLAGKGTVLRLRNQEADGFVVGQIEFDVGAVLATGDIINLFDLAPNTYLEYLRFRMPGMNAGADSGFESTCGYASEGTLLAPDPDVDAFSAAVDDGVGTFIEADLNGTHGTVFPGAGPTGGKAIYDNDIVHVNLYVDNAAPAAAVTVGRNVITFEARYVRLALDGNVLPSEYEPAPIELPVEPAVINFDYNGQSAGSED